MGLSVHLAEHPRFFLVPRRVLDQRTKKIHWRWLSTRNVTCVKRTWNTYLPEVSGPVGVYEYLYVENYNGPTAEQIKAALEEKQRKQYAELCDTAMSKLAEAMLAVEQLRNMKP